MAPRKTKTPRTTKAAKTAADLRGTTPTTKTKASAKAKAQPLPVAEPAPAPPTPAPAGDALPSQQPAGIWKDAWADIRMEAENLDQACAQVGITLFEYEDECDRDSKFQAVAVLFDEVRDSQIKDSLQRNAASGDIRFQSLYYSRVRQQIFAKGQGSRVKLIVPPEEAEAILRERLKILNSGIDPLPPALSNSSSSRAQPPSDRKSAKGDQ